MLRVVVAAPPFVADPDDLARLPAAADIVELRLDLLEDAARRPDAWVERSPRPVMATVRRRVEGGAFVGTPEEAARILERAAAAGAAYLDVEQGVGDYLAALPAGVRLVASRHGDGPFSFRPPARIAGRAPAFAKHAWRVASRADLEAMERIVSGDAAAGGPGTVAVPFGPLGALRAALSRGLLYGGADEAGVGVVEGQPALRVLLDELRAGEVTPGARRFGLLGRPPSRSPSPAMHNAAFRHHDLDAIYVPLPGLDPASALELGFAGFSVTTPYKAAALAVASEADATARETGAANTLVLVPGGYRASNTDVDAVEAALPPASPGASGAYVHGAGGYARAAIVALRRRGYAVRVGARRAEAARALADAFGIEGDGGIWRRRREDAVLVNATPLGTDGTRPAPLAEGSLEGLWILDAPYAAAGKRTGLEAAGSAEGARVVGGRALLRLQARAQAALFCGRAVPDFVLDLALRSLRPLCLLGLRGAGKTTAGRLVARLAGRPFLDLDDEVERITGRTPATWIETEGEAAFRRVEADALSRVAGRRGLVVACGGGVLEHPSSRTIIETQADAVWLSLPPATAARRMRGDARRRPPLVEGAGAEEEARLLLRRREDAWRSVAGQIVDASREGEAVARDVLEAWTGIRLDECANRAP